MGLSSSTNFDEPTPMIGAAVMLKRAMNPTMEVDKSNKEEVTFQSIVDEVNALKSSIAHKALVTSPVGKSYVTCMSV